MIGCHHAVLKRSEAHQGFDGRARRIDAANGAVVHRPLRIIRQCEVLSATQTARKQIGIERRRTHECDHVTVRRIDGDDGAALSAQGFFGDLLHVLIDGQEEVVARDRFLAHEIDPCAADALDAATLRVHEQLLQTGRTVQLGLVRFLHAALARERRAGVVVDVQCLLVFLADGADVAGRMHAADAQRVIAGQARLYIDPGEVVSACSKTCELLFVELQLDRHRVKDTPRANVLLDGRNVIGIEQTDFREPGKRRIEIRNLLAPQLQLIGRSVGRKRHTVAIEDESPIGRNRLDLDAITLRQIEEVVVLDDLQPHQTRDDRTDRERNDHTCRNRALIEQLLLGVMIFDADRAGH